MLELTPICEVRGFAEPGASLWLNRAGVETMRRLRTITREHIQRFDQVCDADVAHLLGLDAGRPPQWADAACSQWGGCGVGTWESGRVTSFVLMSPGKEMPVNHPLAGRLSRQDSAALIAAWIPGRRGHAAAACGRSLINRTSGWLTGSVPAIEAAGTGMSSNLWTPDISWLRAIGFREVAHTSANAVQVMELDLSTTVGSHVDLPSRLVTWVQQEFLQPEAFTKTSRCEKSHLNDGMGT